MIRPTPVSSFNYRYTPAELEKFDRLVVKVRLRCLTKDEAEWLCEKVYLEGSFPRREDYDYVWQMLGLGV